jgi:DNA primase
MNSTTAKKISIKNILSNLGFHPASIHGEDLFYFSPFRDEAKASFKVNVLLNVWYDFGAGTGGTPIDFICQYKNCDVKTALSIIQDVADEKRNTNNFSLSTAKNTIPSEAIKNIIPDKLIISMIKIIPLIEYLQTRRIALELALRYCKQVQYSIKNKSFFGIGFKNDNDGWEVRNKYSKINLMGKATTTIQSSVENAVMNVYEGFFDFLSLLMIHPEKKAENHIILNGAGLLEKLSINQLLQYENVNLFFDNDYTGDQITEKLQAKIPNSKDERSSYKDFKDLNEYLLGGFSQYSP